MSEQELSPVVQAADTPSRVRRIVARVTRYLSIHHVLTATVWLYLSATLAVWILLRLEGDRWWFATVLLFAPRFLYSLPLALLAPLAACGNLAGCFGRWLLLRL